MAWYEKFIGAKPDTLTSGIASPWADSDGYQFSQVVASEVFGDVAASYPMSREQAMSVPAVAKGRNLLVGAIANLPLVALDKTGVLANQPAWLYRTDSPSGVTPYERMAWTVDSLIFTGMALWYVERGAIGQITTANYVPDRDWQITNGHIQIDEQDVPESNVILFNHPSNGLLTEGARTLRAAIAIEKSLESRARNPIPLTVIRHADGTTKDEMLEQDEIVNLLTTWQTARRSPDGALGYLPAGLTIDTHGGEDANASTEARNAIRTDVGSYLNIPVSMLDGTVSQASLTYSTAEGNRNRFWDESVSWWIDTITSRLSMDDSVNRGTRVRFDLSSAFALTPAPTGTPTED